MPYARHSLFRRIFRRSPKVYASWIIFAVFAVVVVISYLLPDDYAVSKPRMASRLWLTETSGTRVLNYITTEDRTRRVRISGGGRFSTPVYRSYSYERYHLHAREARSGKLLKVLPISNTFEASRGREQKFAPEVIGPTTATLWIFNKGKLEAREPTTLAVLATHDSLAAANPQIAEWLPKESKFYKNSALHGVLTFRGQDGEFYQVEPGTWKVTTLDPDSFRKLDGWNESVEDGWRLLPKAGMPQFHTSSSSFCNKIFITSTAKWYALLSRDELRSLDAYQRREQPPYGDSARSLYRTDYTLDEKREIYIKHTEVEKLGDEKFLLGAFLMRSYGIMWDVPDPSSTLVLHKDKLGEAEPWQITRLARDGTAVWKTNLGLPDFEQVADAGDVLIMFGYLDRDVKTYRKPEQIVWLDTKTGTTSRITIATEPLEN